MKARTRELSPWLVVVGFFATVTIFGYQSTRMEQDASWDLRNYHYYNAYAFLYGRLGVDYAPAGIQTYHNPVVDVPFYVIIESFPPRWAGFAFGALHGISFWLMFRLAGCILGKAHHPHNVLLALICAGVGMHGAGTVSELGTTLHDLTITPLLIGSLLLLCRQAAAETRSTAPASLMAAVVASGFFLGAAVGLKYTFAIYGPGLALSLLILRGRQRAWTPVLCWTASAAIGLAVTAGYWMYQLWSRFGNPLGFYANELFQSPYFMPEKTPLRFPPRGILQSLFLPFYFRVTQWTISETPLQEIRFALAYVLILAVVLACVLRCVGRPRRMPATISLTRSEWMLLTFFVSSYILWQRQFSTYRYLLPLELVAPLVIYVLLRQLIVKPYTRLIVCSILFLLVVGTMQAPNWGRVPWADSFFGTVAPAIPEPSRSLVLISTSTPVAFVIPAFPPRVRFMRIDPSFVTAGSKMGEEIQRIVAGHDGPAYVLSDVVEIARIDDHLAPHRLVVARSSCTEVRNRVARGIIFCETTRGPKT